MKIRRNAASTKGFLRRLEDARFEQVEDPREQNRITHPLEPTLNLAVLSLVTAARSTRAVEDRSQSLKDGVKRSIELSDPISDNAFGLLMPRLQPNDLRKVLRSQIKAEWKRKNLRPTHLPWSSVAIDGKHVATLSEKRLRGLVSQATEFDGDSLDTAQLREILRSRFPQVQLKDHGDWLCGLVRVHRATLISSAAAVVMDQQTILGATNESGTILKSLRALFGHYGKTKMLELVTMDAGNTTKEVAAYIAAQQADYLLALKSVQGHLFELAGQKLGPDAPAKPVYTRSEEYNGQTVCYTVFSHSLVEGHGDYSSARQLFRIERVAATDEKTSVGNRYFVGSMPADQMSGEQAYMLARAHWRCENEGHWTADAIWEEDAKRTPWTTHPQGVLVVGLLRAVAINILATLRALSRIERDGELKKPPWQTVIEHALLALCDTILDTTAFDAFDD
jgi:predicted transposase YbfD/YdcC